MAFPIIGGSQSGGYLIDNSLRFNDNDSAYLSRTQGSGGNRRTWTFSCWVKLSEIATNTNFIFSASDDGSSNTEFKIQNHELVVDFWNGSSSSYRIDSSNLLRDASAFYHLVLRVDTTQSTSADRVRMYINGTQVTAFNTNTVGSQNFDTDLNNGGTIRIGADARSPADYWDGYMTEVYMIEGQSLPPTDFGEFDEDSGIWKPIEYAGTYGTNGFYLDFENSGSLGADQSGNSNNFTPTNLASTDQTTDTPTNNFATLNALRFSGSPTYSEGNLKAVTTSEAEYVSSSIAVKTGKWYWETRFSAIATIVMVGVQNVDVPQNTTFYQSGRFSYGSTGSLYYNSASESLATYTTGDIIGIALDMDGDSISWYKNNTLVTTKTLSSYTIDTSKEVEHFIMSGSSGGSAGLTVSVNYGQNGSFNGTETAQGNADGNGYGDFYYAPPSGYLALCTQNLATELSPTIDDGSQYFNTVLYTGNGSTQSITGVGFQPDWTWIKERSSTSEHEVYDSTRGATKLLSPSTTDAEGTNPSALTSFDSDGFSVGSGGAVNENSQTYVAWNWLANAGSTSSNTDGSITSTVQANTTAGFSIVTFTGNGSNDATIGHGLGTTPTMIITKNRDDSVHWRVWHKDLTSNYVLFLASTLAEISPTGQSNGYIKTVNSSTYSVYQGNVDTNGVNGSGDAMVAYCFAEIEGYSKFGSYTGNGSSDGPFVYTGFRPAWILIKRSDASGDNWMMFDNKRDPFNTQYHLLQANSSGAEATADPTVTNCNFHSNGFKFPSSWSGLNASGGTYIYMAFAENPFVTSGAVPVTAR